MIAAIPAVHPTRLQPAAGTLHLQSYPAQLTGRGAVRALSSRCAGPGSRAFKQGWRASPAHHLAGDALRRRRPSLWSNRRTAALTLSHRQRRLRAGLSFPAECTPAGVLVQPIVGAPLPTRPSSPAAGPTCGLPPEDPAELRPSTSAATTDQTVCLGWELRLELRIRRIRSRRPRSFSFGHSLTAAQGYIDHQ